MFEKVATSTVKGMSLRESAPIKPKNRLAAGAREVWENKETLQE